MPKSAVKSPTFDEYKSIKDEIIEISEMRFENLLTNKLDQFRRDFRKELMDELNPRFDTIDSRFDTIDSRFDTIDSRFNAIDAKFNTIDSNFNTIDSKFNAIDSKFDAIDSKFDAMDSKFTAMFDTLKWSVWSLPLVMTVLVALFTVLLKYVI